MDGQRKITANIYVALDGTVEAPEQWHFPYSNDEFMDALFAQVRASDAMLLGRRTYDVFAGHWPQQGSEVVMADHMNNTPKYVVSNTLTDPKWQNTTVITGDVAGQIAELKRQPGKNISITGSATLVSWLLNHGLLDELTLLVHPLVVGSPHKRLFAESDQRVPLALVDVQRFKTDVLKLTYAAER